jgi:hypothetical protein
MLRLFSAVVKDASELDAPHLEQCHWIPAAMTGAMFAPLTGTMLTALTGTMLAALTGESRRGSFPRNCPCSRVCANEREPALADR